MLEIFALGLALSTDSFSVAVALGVRPFTRRQALRYALLTSSAGAAMAWIGVLAGARVLDQIADYDHWVASGLVAIVALRMAYEGCKGLLNPEAPPTVRPHGIAKLVGLSIASNIDALGVGLGIQLAKKPTLPFVMAVGVGAFAATLVGLALARRLSRRFGPLLTLVGATLLAILAAQLRHI